MKQSGFKYPNKYSKYNLPMKRRTFTKQYRPYLYGAYGSNLNFSQMQLRCPLAKQIGVVRLEDYELVFRGVADVEHSIGSEVMLGVWQITDQCEAALDRYEGFPNLYGKKMLDINDSNFEALYDRDYNDVIEDHKVMIYQMTDQTQVYRPAQRYLLSIAKGCADFGIPKDWLEAALRKSYTEETPAV